jgi:hypothetical protein
MDRWMDLLYHLHKLIVFIQTLEDLNVYNVHSPANIYTILNFFPCSPSISTVTTATLVFSMLIHLLRQYLVVRGLVFVGTMEVIQLFQFTD